LSAAWSLLPRDADPDPVREFEAEVMVLNHPPESARGTNRSSTSRRSARPRPSPRKTADSCRVIRANHRRFKFRPYPVEEGQKFVFREGPAKGVGTVTDVHPAD